jgi:putative transposase
MSERRACKAIGCCRMTMRYQTTRADDAGLRQRMKAIAQERRRFGYRRLHVLLKREGYMLNHKKLFRLYREEKLAVRRRGDRKRAIGTRAPMLVPMAPNDRWSLDFVSDQLTDCRRFRILTIVDGCTRESLALVADTSLPGVRVARELDRLMIERGKPKITRERQWQRAYQQRHPDMGGPSRRRMALHRTGQAHAERIHREL